MRLIAIIVVLGACWRRGGADCPADRDVPVHDEGRLHTDLFCDYDYDFRPVKDHTIAVTVKVRFAIKYISFDSLEETFTLHSWVALTWKDEFLNWTPSDYGNIKTTQVESHKIWSPRMSLFNADASVYQSDDIYTTCLLSYDGTVSCVPHLTHSGICRTNLRRWPFDKQNCTLYFGSWMHSNEQINFTFYPKEPVNLDDYQNGPGWKLMKVHNYRVDGKYVSKSNNTHSMLMYTFYLERVAAGPAAIVVVPSVVIVLLTLTALLLDIKGNTRLLLICFSLYGHFMFLTEVGYSIPKHSSDTPIILLFLRDSMIITLAGLLETFGLMYLGRKVTPAPTWIVSLSRLVNIGPGKYVVFTEFDPSSGADAKLHSEEGFSPSIATDRPQTSHEWIQFANFINSMLFIVALLAYLILICNYIPYGY